MKLKHGPHAGNYVAECPLDYIAELAKRNDRLGDHAQWILNVWSEFGLLTDDYMDDRPPF